jgi:sucrose-6-phosphate hydrolase SacC (GH32 family)
MTVAKRKQRQTKCLAFGDGIDYEKLPDNPVLSGKDPPEAFFPCDFRDPKVWQKTEAVIAYSARQRQKMALTRYI